MEDTDVHATPTPDAGDAGASEIEALGRKLVEAEAQLVEMRDTVLRERAELDNQRKRLQRELDQARRFANEKLLGALLPVFDNLERGLQAEGDLGALRDGVELTLRELIRIAEANGLRAVGAPGEVFDPEHHEAMNVIDDSLYGPGHVAAVVQKGYLLNERLLRPALVSVSR